MDGFHQDKDIVINHPQMAGLWLAGLTIHTEILCSKRGWLGNSPWIQLISSLQPPVVREFPVNSSVVVGPIIYPLVIKQFAMENCIEMVDLWLYTYQKLWFCKANAEITRWWQFLNSSNSRYIMIHLPILLPCYPVLGDQQNFPGNRAVFGRKPYFQGRSTKHIYIYILYTYIYIYYLPCGNIMVVYWAYHGDIMRISWNEIFGDLNGLLCKIAMFSR